MRYHHKVRVQYLTSQLLPSSSRQRTTPDGNARQRGATDGGSSSFLLACAAPLLTYRYPLTPFNVTAISNNRLKCGGVNEVHEDGSCMYSGSIYKDAVCQGAGAVVGAVVLE